MLVTLGSCWTFDEKEGVLWTVEFEMALLVTSLVATCKSPAAERLQRYAQGKTPWVDSPCAEVPGVLVRALLAPRLRASPRSLSLCP